MPAGRSLRHTHTNIPIFSRQCFFQDGGTDKSEGHYTIMELLFSRPARAHGRLRVNFTHIVYGYTGNLETFPGLPGLLLPSFSRTSKKKDFVHGQLKGIRSC